MKTSKAKTQNGAGLIGARGLLLASFAMTASIFFNAAPLRASDTMAESGDDAAITSQVKTSLFYHLALHFHVKTNEGVVTLSGNADNTAERNLNTRLAAEIKGVKSVVNNMVIPVVVAGNN